MIRCDLYNLLDSCTEESKYFYLTNGTHAVLFLLTSKHVALCSTCVEIVDWNGGRDNYKPISEIEYKLTKIKND